MYISKKQIVGLVISHPDDEVLMMELVRYLFDRKIKSYLILLTNGEKGINPELRINEFINSAKSLDFDFETLKFPDLGLAYVPIENMVDKLASVVLKNNIDMLVSFSPYELTYGFDHPDHNRAGEITRLVSTAMIGKRNWLRINLLMPKSFIRPKVFLKRYYQGLENII